MYAYSRTYILTHTNSLTMTRNDLLFDAEAAKPLRANATMATPWTVRIAPTVSTRFEVTKSRSSRRSSEVTPTAIMHIPKN